MTRLDEKINKYLDEKNKNENDKRVDEKVKFKIEDSTDATEYLDEMESKAEWLNDFFNSKIVEAYLDATDMNFSTSGLVAEYKSIQRIAKDLATKCKKLNINFSKAE